MDVSLAEFGMLRMAWIAISICSVVKTKIKEADAVWIVSNIVRAINDKTAKDLLGEQFRRQMVREWISILTIPHYPEVTPCLSPTSLPSLVLLPTPA